MKLKFRSGGGEKVNPSCGLYVSVFGRHSKLPIKFLHKCEKDVLVLYMYMFSNTQQKSLLTFSTHEPKAKGLSISLCIRWSNKIYSIMWLQAKEEERR